MAERARTHDGESLLPLVGALGINLAMAAALGTAFNLDAPQRWVVASVPVTFVRATPAPDPPSPQAPPSDSVEQEDEVVSRPPAEEIVLDAPPPRRPRPSSPAVDLPETDRRVGAAPGLIGVDCNTAFSEEGDRTACIGETLPSEWGERWITLGEGADDIGPGRPAPGWTNDASEPSLVLTAAQRERFGTEIRAKRAFQRYRDTTPVTRSGADAASTGGGFDSAAPPPILTTNEPQPISPRDDR